MKTNTIIAAGALFVLGLIACEKDREQDPSPTPDPPQQELPNPLPPEALLRELRWSENDFYDFQYNDKDQASKIHYQYQYVQNDPTKIRTLDYDIQYDAQDRPELIRYTGGFSTRYFYHGDLIHRTKEFYPGGDWAKEVTYIYADNRIVRENWLVNGYAGEPVSVYKYEFGYDKKGNLAKVETYEQVVDSVSGQLRDVLLETVEYSQFDDRINPNSWMLRYPFLPQVRWQFNNPGREEHRLAGGGSAVITYTYSYNDKGLPVVRQRSTPNGTYSMKYLYR